MAAAPEIPGKIEHLALPISQLGCAGAAPSIERALRTVPGVSRVYVNVVTEMAFIEYATDKCDEGALRAALARAGYGELVPELSRTTGEQHRGPTGAFSRLLTGVARAVRRSAEPRRSP